MHKEDDIDEDQPQIKDPVILTDIALQGGTHYTFDYSTEQLRVTNPRPKKVKVKKEGTAKAKGKKEGTGAKVEVEKK